MYLFLIRLHCLGFCISAHFRILWLVFNTRILITWLLFRVYFWAFTLYCMFFIKFVYYHWYTSILCLFGFFHYNLEICMQLRQTFLFTELCIFQLLLPWLYFSITFALFAFLTYQEVMSYRCLREHYIRWWLSAFCWLYYWWKPCCWNRSSFSFIKLLLNLPWCWPFFWFWV